MQSKTASTNRGDEPVQQLFLITLVFILGMLATAPKSHAECFNDAIKTVSESGDLIVMESMEVFKIDLGDAPTASLSGILCVRHN